MFMLMLMSRSEPALTIRLFADDALLYGTICCDENTADHQDDLYRLEDWQQKWKMEFDPL